MQELRVVGVRVELPGNQPILLLKETQGERYLPIWIGAVEAAAIAFEQQGVRPARPMTHDLLREVVRALGKAFILVGFVLPLQPAGAGRLVRASRLSKKEEDC